MCRYSASENMRSETALAHVPSFHEQFLSLALLLSEVFQLSTFSSIISQANRRKGHRYCLWGAQQREREKSFGVELYNSLKRKSIHVLHLWIHLHKQCTSLHVTQWCDLPMVCTAATDTLPWCKAVSSEVVKMEKNRTEEWSSLNTCKRSDFTSVSLLNVMKNDALYTTPVAIVIRLQEKHDIS